MINARKELDETLDTIIGRYKLSVKCAWIKYGSPKPKFIKLAVGYAESDFTCFMNQLDFEYDNGWGGQELFGVIWLDDGSWLERGEYDGSEWWDYKRTPEIPEELTEQDWITNT